MLHIISSTAVVPSEFQRMTTGDCLLFRDSAVLLLQRGSEMAQSLQALDHEVRLYALLDDIQLYGVCVDGLMPGVETVDYIGFVKLTEDHAVIQSL